MKWLCAILLALWIVPARSATMIVGVNLVNPMRATPAQRAAELDQLRAAGVTAVRSSLEGGTSAVVTDQAIKYAQSLSARGIKLDLLLLGFKYRLGAPVRPVMAGFPGMRAGSPLSAVDPDASEAYFRDLFGRLDAAGVTLASVELGNEINSAAFNAEFPLPGEGRVLGLADLTNDPEGKKIAQGYLQYLEILKRLKTARDASRLNHDTPIISAGLAGVGPNAVNSQGEGAVSIAATLAFMRAHGLDDLVDGYGVHTYPSDRAPGDPAADQQRLNSLRNDIFPACRASAGGHPCWLTEWGFRNQNQQCPIDDTMRTALVTAFRGMIAGMSQYQVGGLFYYSWDGNAGGKSFDPTSIFRCGGLTAAGRAAVADAP